MTQRKPKLTIADAIVIRDAKFGAPTAQFSKMLGVPEGRPFSADMREFDAAMTKLAKKHGMCLIGVAYRSAPSVTGREAALFEVEIPELLRNDSYTYAIQSLTDFHPKGKKQ